MYRLPEDHGKISIFAEEEGRTCAKSLSSIDRKKADINYISNCFFTNYNLDNLLCDDLDWGKEIFMSFFKQGFLEV